jgi:hypothetical protein
MRKMKKTPKDTTIPGNCKKVNRKNKQKKNNPHVARKKVYLYEKKLVTMKKSLIILKRVSKITNGEFFFCYFDVY